MVIPSHPKIPPLTLLESTPVPAIGRRLLRWQRNNDYGLFSITGTLRPQLGLDVGLVFGVVFWGKSSPETTVVFLIKCSFIFFCKCSRKNQANRASAQQHWMFPLTNPMELDGTHWDDLTDMGFFMNLTDIFYGTQMVW